jgi:hypothetical protein
MRKLPVVLTLLSGLIPLPTFAQQAPPSSAPPDSTGAVKSESLGMPGSISNPVDDYLRQKSLNNLPNRQSDTASDRKLGAARPAKPNELTAGAPVNDKTGVAMATIAQVDPDGVIVSTPTGKVKIPSDAFGHNKSGLLLDMTKAQFEQVVTKANAGS